MTCAVDRPGGSTPVVEGRGTSACAEWAKAVDGPADLVVDGVLDPIDRRGPREAAPGVIAHDHIAGARIVERGSDLPEQVRDCVELLQKAGCAAWPTGADRDGYGVPSPRTEAANAEAEAVIAEVLTCPDRSVVREIGAKLFAIAASGRRGRRDGSARQEDHEKETHHTDTTPTIAIRHRGPHARTSALRELFSGRRYRRRAVTTSGVTLQLPACVAWPGVRLAPGGGFWLFTR